MECGEFVPSFHIEYNNVRYLSELLCMNVLLRKVCMTDYKSIKTINKDRMIFLLVNVLFFTIVLAINAIYPYCWDDELMANAFSGTNFNLKDIVSHVYSTYYLQWSGKFVPFSIVLFFTTVSKWAYNIVDSLMYVMLANIIYSFWRNRKNNYWVLLTIYASLWLFIPWFGTVIFWVDGAIEYLWMLIPILLLGKIYYMHYFCEKGQRRSCIGMLILGLFAGCGLEATGSALVFGLSVMMIAKLIRREKIEKWEITGLVGVLIGFATLMLAPGNFRRASVALVISDISHSVFYRFARASYFFVLYEGILFGISIALIVLLYLCKRNPVVGEKQDNKWIIYAYTICKEPIVFVVLALVSVYVMTFVSAFAVRIFLTPTVLLIISCGISIKKIGTSSMELFGMMQKYSTIIRILVTSVSIYVIVQMLTAFLFCLFTGDPVTKNIQYTNMINDVRLFN